MKQIKGKYKIALVWLQIIMYPICMIGYVVVAFGIALKIFGYLLKFDFNRVWNEIQGINEDFSL